MEINFIKQRINSLSQLKKNTRGKPLLSAAKQQIYITLQKKIPTFSPFSTSYSTGETICPEKIFTNKGEINMKKFLALAVLLGSSVFFVPSIEAKTSSNALELNNSATPQISIRLGNRQRNRYRRARVVTRTRIIRVGYRTYREVVQYRYRPNGSVTTRVLSRTRIR
jgi:hypothetical protein